MNTKTHRHPKALPFLFLTEMWERFGFYVVQGMLVLYMTKAHGYSDDKSYTISGLFTALAYFAPIIGGFIADRILGFKTTIIWGGIFLSLGYALFALPYNFGFYLGLATIILGTGLFKPNISSILGALYQPGDSDRDVGFTIFYIGINLGILLAGLTSEAIANHLGWHAAFGFASVGLIIALGVFSAGIKWGHMRNLPKPHIRKVLVLHKAFFILYCLAAIGLISLLLQSKLLSTWLFPVTGVFLVFFMFFLAIKQQGNDRNNLLMLNTLIISSVVFWTLYWQMFLSANLFIDRLVDKNLFGIQIPTTVFYSIQSIFVISLGLILAWGWEILNASQKNPSAFTKFILAIALIGMAFFILAMSTFFPNSMNQINLLWIVFSYFLIAAGELLLSPIGLSAVTLLAPLHLTGLMMGIWFVSLGFGGQFGGALAKLASVPMGASSEMQLLIYRTAFLDFAYIAFATVVLLFIISKIIKIRGNRKILIAAGSTPPEQPEIYKAEAPAL